MNTDKYVEILGDQIDKLSCQVEDVKDEVQLMKEVLNNGIVSATYKNTKKVEELNKKVSNIDTEIKKDGSYKEGQIKSWQLILGGLILGGNFLLGVITVLGHLGII